jgi:hypothetical protein
MSCAPRHNTLAFIKQYISTGFTHRLQLNNFGILRKWNHFEADTVMVIDQGQYLCF